MESRSGRSVYASIALSEDGRKDEWYKYERIKILQDDHGRAIQANFAVIDFSKWEDKPNDIHSSKNIAIPLTPGRLLSLLNRGRVTDATAEVRLRIAAEPGFNPQTDIDTGTLRFGAPEQVDFGRGAAPLKTEKDGHDLVAVFPGKGMGFKDDNFAGKLLGRTAAGKLLFGYTRLPWVIYDEPILTVRQPRVAGQGKDRKLRIEVSNYGLVPSKPSEVRITAPGADTFTATCPALKPYERTTIEAAIPETCVSGRDYEFRIATGLDLQQPNTFSAAKIKLP